MARYKYAQAVPVQQWQIRALDLRAELRKLNDEGEVVECYEIMFRDEGFQQVGERAEAVFVPGTGRAGIAWGADANWTDAESIEDAMDQHRRGEMTD